MGSGQARLTLNNSFFKRRPDVQAELVQRRSLLNIILQQFSRSAFFHFGREKRDSPQTSCFFSSVGIETVLVFLNNLA